ncbi:MAG TPA: hypothetical protein VK988_01725 [Acidimicrobiales bacterium]|nr:hypothetical protein [Acidimicrobiales bacterium]
MSQLCATASAIDGTCATSSSRWLPNVVLRYECDKVLPSEGPPVPESDRERGVIDALEACAAATLWLHYHEGLLARAEIKERGYRHPDTTPRQARIRRSWAGVPDM